jgi:hypothetical protein
MSSKAKPQLQQHPEDEPWARSKRIAEGWGPKDLAFIPAFLALIGSGAGTFMAHDAAAGKVPYLSNLAVWLGLVHIAYSLAVASYMYWGKLSWTAPQMALTAMSMLALPYFLNFASLISICIYGTGVPLGKSLLALTALAWNAWWVIDVARRCRTVWNTESLRQLVWVDYGRAVVYRQFGAQAAMEQVGIRFYPPASFYIIAIFCGIAMTWWRSEIVSYFGTPFIHLLLASLGGAVGVLGISFCTAMFMLAAFYPLKIHRESGKLSFVDMITPAKPS